MDEFTTQSLSLLPQRGRLGSIEGLIKKAKKVFKKNDTAGPRRIKVNGYYYSKHQSSSLYDLQFVATCIFNIRYIFHVHQIVFYILLQSSYSREVLCFIAWILHPSLPTLYDSMGTAMHIFTAEYLLDLYDLSWRNWAAHLIQVI